MWQVLLVEDNRGDVLLVRHALAKHNIKHELAVAKDGSEAIHFIGGMGAPGHPPCPDVILLDLNLPKLSGPQVLERLRQHPLCGQTPVIVVSSSDASRDRERLYPLGVSHYFRKPVDLEAFLRLGVVVKDVLEKK